MTNIQREPANETGKLDYDQMVQRANVAMECLPSQLYGGKFAQPDAADLEETVLEDFVSNVDNECFRITCYYEDNYYTTLRGKFVQSVIKFGVEIFDEDGDSHLIESEIDSVEMAVYVAWCKQQRSVFLDKVATHYYAADIEWTEAHAAEISAVIQERD